MDRRGHCIAAWTLVVGLCLFAAGCGKKQAPAVCYPVRGQVMMDGKPLPEARLVFHSAVERAEGVPKPLGVCDEEGRFKVSTFGIHDGAPLGEYAITVEYREPRLVGEEEVRDGPSLLEPKYSDPKVTTLRYEVVQGENEIPTLQVEKLKPPAEDGATE